MAFSAITEWYVNDAGSGSGTGTTEPNAMSFTTFTDYMSTGGSFTASPGDRFNIKGAITSRTTTTDVWVNGGTITSPVIVRGYSSVITDGYQGRTNDNGPIITTNMPTITYTTGRLNVTAPFIITEALNITSAASGATVTLTTGTAGSTTRCNIVNSGTNAASVGVTLNGNVDSLVNSDVSLTGASTAAEAVNITTQNAKVVGCRIKGGPGAGIVVQTGSNSFPVIVNNTIYGCALAGIQVSVTSDTAIIIGNTIVGGGADGINIITANTFVQFLVNNMITDNAGDGIDMVSTSNGAFAMNNRFRDNANTYNNAGDWITATKYNDVTSGAGTSDYVNAGGNNYNLIWTSPGRGAGSPLYADIGALQAPTPTATPVATPTATSTPTPTATATASFTPCAPTPGPTATSTPTPTATATVTPTPTAPIEMSYGFPG
jgi:cell division septation protein DedD